MPRIEAPESGVRVRMYRPGFGDCFLLTFRGRDGGPVHCLIDCGVHARWQPSDPGAQSGSNRIKDIVAHIREATGGHLHVVAVTHEHADHVSGFHYAKDLFADMTVGEVWAAWTEDPESERARAFDKARGMMLRQLRGLAPALVGLGQTYDNVGQVMGFFDIPMGATAFGVSTREARNRALELSNQKRFLLPHRAPVELPGVDGVRVFVLGPPEDERLLRAARPTGTPGEVYEDDGTEEPSSAPAGERVDFGPSRPEFQPFAGNHRIPREWVRANPGDYAFLHHHYGLEEGRQDAWRRIEDDLAGAAENLALQLDSATNNTSLVLAFELGRGGRVLLFPGDAQVGNWNSWHLRSWTEANGAAPGEVVTAADLLNRTVLYKVGHHGSHNATLKERGLEMMTSSELSAMIPVDERWALERRPYPWKMPFGPMYRDLEGRTRGRILRTDAGVPEGTDWRPWSAPIVEELYIDLDVPEGRSSAG